MRMTDELYNTEDTGSMLKSFALNGNFEGRFKRYKHYKRWVKKRLIFSRRWMPHILIAAQYNIVVRLLLLIGGAVGLWEIWQFLSDMYLWELLRIKFTSM